PVCERDNGDGAAHDGLAAGALRDLRAGDGVGDAYQFSQSSPRCLDGVVEAAGHSGRGWRLMLWFMKFISTKSFMPFVWYRIVLGVVIIVLVSAGVLSPGAGEAAH